MDHTSQSVQGSKKFIINLFGESGTGKTTTLRRLIELLRYRAKLNLEVADGFQARDRRAIMWYRSGKKFSGAVCVCTSGDSLAIIHSNVNFFERHFDVLNTNTPWQAWCDAIRDSKPPLEETELKNTKMHSVPIGILVTASRKPLQDYGKSLCLPPDCSHLDIPIQIDAWHGLKRSMNPCCDWMSSARIPAEVLLFHVNYILRNARFRSYVSKKGHRVGIKAIRSSISRDN